MRHLLIYFTLVWPVALYAQAGTDPVKPFLERIKAAYAQASYLGFRVTYLYTNESHPDQPNDSITGEVALDKGRCRYVMDGIETLVTGNHTIQIMRENQSIYLSASGHSSVVDPIYLIDSVLQHMNGVHSNLSKRGSMDVLAISFPEGLQFTRIEMGVDEKTGFLREMTYFLHTASFVDKTDQGYDPEGRVLVRFNHYTQGAFGDALFDENAIITKTAGRYQPVGKYRAYQLYLATPNL